MLFQHTINKGSFVHLEFQTMICISLAEKGHFIQNCSMTQNTVFQYVINHFFLCKKSYYIYFTILNLAMLR